MSDLGFVHRFVPSASGSLRVLLLLHDTGGDESDLLPLGREIDPEAALLGPRGKVSEKDSLRFFQRFAEAVFDEEDGARTNWRISSLPQRTNTASNWRT